jgi:chromosome segregation ATPase
LKSREIYEIILNTPIYNIRAKRSLYREEARLKRDMAELEKQIEEANDEVQEITKDALAKQEEIKVIEANIKDNEKEEAIVQKKNKDIAKEYGEKFNLLNWQQQQVGQQPNESDDAYIKRLKDLENLKADPTLYKQKAINEM